MKHYQGYIYILSNKKEGVLYTGVTNNLKRRIVEHKLKINPCFTNKYNIDKLVHYELYEHMEQAIHREKQLKKWKRYWKIKLIEQHNPTWADLSEELGITDEYIQSVKELYSRIR